MDRIMAHVDHVKRRLWTDYRDAAGEDYNQPVTVWHSPQAGDGELLASVRKQLAQRGCTLTGLWELAGHAQDGKVELLWMGPQ